MKDINPIIEKIKRAPFVKSAVTMMGTESYSFHDVRRYWLEEKFLEMGF